MNPVCTPPTQTSPALALPPRSCARLQVGRRPLRHAPEPAELTTPPPARLCLPSPPGPCISSLSRPVPLHLSLSLGRQLYHSWQAVPGGWTSGTQTGRAGKQEHQEWPIQCLVSMNLTLEKVFSEAERAAETQGGGVPSVAQRDQ